MIAIDPPAGFLDSVAYLPAFPGATFGLMSHVVALSAMCPVLRYFNGLAFPVEFVLWLINLIFPACDFSKRSLD